MNKILLKRGNKADLERVNPVLSQGEPLFIIDENKLKVGDGTTPFNELPYIDVGERLVETVIREVAKGGGVSKKFVMDYVDTALEGIEISGGSGTVTDITSADGTIVVSPIAGGYDLSVTDKYVNVTGDTMTGTLAVSGAGIQLDLNHTPAHQEGKIFYDSVNHTLAYYNDNNEITVNVGQEQLVRVRNSTGSTIANGKVVVVSGSTGNHPNIVLADNTLLTAHDTIGVATHDINHNEDGYITVAGMVNQLNTNSFSTEGITLWLGTNGNLTETEPTAPNHKIKIGYLIRKHNNQGRILVAIDSGSDLKDLHDVLIGDYEDGALLVANGPVWSPGANVNDLATKSEVASISGSLDNRIDLLEAIKDDTNEPNGFVNRTSSTLSFNNANRTFTITGTHEVYCDGVKFTFGTTSQQINNTHGMHFIYYNPNGVWTYSDGVPWSINGGDAMIAAVYWDAINQLGVLVEERHGCIMDAASHYYLHSLNGTQRITAGAISGFTIQTNSNASLQVAVGATTLADEDITYTTVSNLIAGSYRFARRSGTGSAWVVAETNTNPFIVATNNIEYNQLNGSTWQMTEITTNNTYVNYYIVAATTVEGTYSYLLVPGQVTYGSLALAQGEAFNNLNLTGFPFIEFNALYQVTFRYNTAYNNIAGRARLEAAPVLLGLRSATQVVAPVSTHNALSGLQGGTVGEYFHLTSSEYGDLIGRSEVTSVSGSLVTLINSGDSNLQGQINNIVAATGSYALSSDLSNYTLLSTTASISGSLEASKQNNITLVAGSNISIVESPTDTWTISSTSTGTSGDYVGLTGDESISGTKTFVSVPNAPHNTVVATTSAGQSIASGANRKILFGTYITDPQSCVTSSGSDWYYTAKVAGFYLVNCMICFGDNNWRNSGTGEERNLNLLVANQSGTEYARLEHLEYVTTGFSVYLQLAGSAIIYLAQNAQISIYVNHDKTANVALLADVNLNYCNITYIGK